MLVKDVDEKSMLVAFFLNVREEKFKRLLVKHFLHVVFFLQTYREVFTNIHGPLQQSKTFEKSCLQCHDCITHHDGTTGEFDCQQCERCIPCISSFGCDKRLIDRQLDENDVQGLARFFRDVFLYIDNHSHK